MPRSITCIHMACFITAMSRAKSWRRSFGSSGREGDSTFTCTHWFPTSRSGRCFEMAETGSSGLRTAETQFISICIPTVAPKPFFPRSPANHQTSVQTLGDARSCIGLVSDRQRRKAVGARPSPRRHLQFMSQQESNASVQARAAVVSTVQSFLTEVTQTWQTPHFSDFVRKVMETYATRIVIMGVGLI